MRNQKLRNRFSRFSYSSTSTMDTEGHPKGVRMRNRKLRNVYPCFFLTLVAEQVPWLSKVTRRVCATRGCALFNGSEGFPRSSTKGCSLRRSRPIFSMSTGTSPFTGYLPFSRHFIFIKYSIMVFKLFKTCFRI